MICNGAEGGDKANSPEIQSGKKARNLSIVSKMLWFYLVCIQQIYDWLTNLI